MMSVLHGQRAQHKAAHSRAMRTKIAAQEQLWREQDAGTARAQEKYGANLIEMRGLTAVFHGESRIPKIDARS